MNLNYRSLKDKKNKMKKKAFTLVEILIVLALIGIIAGFIHE